MPWKVHNTLHFIVIFTYRHLDYFALLYGRMYQHYIPMWKYMISILLITKASSYSLVWRYASNDSGTRLGLGHSIIIDGMKQSSIVLSFLDQHETFISLLVNVFRYIHFISSGMILVRSFWNPIPSGWHILWNNPRDVSLVVHLPYKLIEFCQNFYTIKCLFRELFFRAIIGGYIIFLLSKLLEIIIYKMLTIPQQWQILLLQNFHNIEAIWVLSWYKDRLPEYRDSQYKDRTIVTPYYLCSGYSYGPLTRYVKLRVAHAPGLPVTLSPPPTWKEIASWRSRHASRAVMQETHTGNTASLYWDPRAMWYPPVISISPNWIHASKNRWRSRHKCYLGYYIFQYAVYDETIVLECLKCRRLM